MVQDYIMAATPILMIAAIVFAIYMIPTVVAVRREHRNVMGIATLNVLLGWTAIGWVLALVWALANPPAPQVTHTIIMQPGEKPGVTPDVRSDA